MIYMDNAATTLQKPEEVKQAILYALEHMGNAGRGGTEAALDASRSIYAVREKLADFFHAESPTRIAFTANSTESLNIALKGLFQPGDHVITTVLEHNSVLRPLYWCQEQGVELTILNCDEKGNLSYEEMENAVRENTKAIVCTHASNLTGNMIDLKRVGQIASEKHILFVVDASQTAGVYPIDVQELGLMYCASQDIKVCLDRREPEDFMLGKVWKSVRYCVEEAAWILITCIIPPRCRRHLRPELLMGMGLQDLAQQLII